MGPVAVFHYQHVLTLVKSLEICTLQNEWIVHIVLICPMAASGVVLPGKNLKALSSRVSLFSCWTAKTPDHGKNVFTCQSRCMWTLVVAASVTIQYNQLETSLLLVNLLFIYQIFVNWKLVRLRNPIFNDGVWFDDPPRGWDFWYVSIRWILFPRYWGK